MAKADPGPAETPVTLVIGFLEVARKKDVQAYVRGFIEKRFEALDESFFNVVPFGGGFLWEAHEGGPGKSYLPGVAAALQADPDRRIWLPSGVRTLEVMMRDGKPLGLMLPSEQAEISLRTGRGGSPVAPASAMRRFRSKGAGLFMLGAVVFTGGIGVLCAAGIAMSSMGVVLDPPRGVPIGQMPHRHWPEAANLADRGIYVGKLEFSNGSWAAVPKRPAGEAASAVPAAAAPPRLAPPAPPPAAPARPALPAPPPATASPPPGPRPAPAPAAGGPAPASQVYQPATPNLPAQPYLRPLTGPPSSMPMPVHPAGPTGALPQGASGPAPPGPPVRVPPPMPAGPPPAAAGASR